MSYKYCFVPKCTNTTSKTPGKIFFCVPRGPLRKKWWTIVRKECGKSLTSTSYCCEDHFNIETDVENHVAVKMGFARSLKLKPGVYPKFFNCQIDRPTVAETSEARHFVEKRKKRKLIETALENNMSFSCLMNTLCYSTERNNMLLATSKVKNEVDPEPFMTTTSDQENKEVVHVIKQEPLDILSDITVKEEPMDELENDSQDNVESKMVNESPTPTTVKEEVHSGLLVATYTISTDQGKKQVVQVIKQEPFDIPCDTFVKQEPLNEIESSEHVEQDSEQSVCVKQEPFDEISIDTSVNKEQFKEIENDAKSQREIVSYVTINQELNKIQKDVRFQCNQCDKSYTLNRHLRRHILSKHYEGVRYNCHHCDKYFSERSNLKKHLNIHDGVKFQCTKCDKSFSQKGYLTTHLLTHEGVKYQCNCCDRSYRQKGYLNTHLLTHEGIKFQCNTCDSSFTHKAHLKKHLIKHEGVRFQCTRCDKSFISKKLLNRHLLMHEGLMYPCNQCDKSFTQKNNLKKHLLSKHSVFYVLV